MADSPRLAELRRQRTLIQTHLAWLDGEIAAEEMRGFSTDAAAQTEGENTPVATSWVAPDAPQAIAASDAAAERAETTGTIAKSADAHAEKIIDAFRVAPNDLQRDVRTGCFLYFAIALVLLFAAVAGLYFALRH